MENATVLIADCNEDFRQELKRIMESGYHVLCAETGDQALRLLREQKPLLLVMDPVLPYMDGVSVLRAAAKEDIRPIVVLASTFFSPYLQQIAPELGVEYLVQKPCNMAMLVERIGELITLYREKLLDMRSLICRTLLENGFSAKYVGFPYVVEAILILLELGPVPLTKVVYPEVAKRYGCGYTGVEHGIRNAVEAAWENRNTVLLEQLFPGEGNHRPSNGTFLNRMYLYFQTENYRMFP